jgi:predicted DNA-binding transcriptional regulator AlpA
MTTDTEAETTEDLLRKILEAISSQAIPSDVRALSREQLAEALNLSTRTIDTMASTGEGPPFMNIGTRRLYPAAALKKWLLERTEK